MIVFEAAAVFVAIIDAILWWTVAVGAAAGLAAAGIGAGIRAAVRRRAARLERRDYDTAA